MPQFILRQRDIAVSSYFIEMLMPAANPTFVKIYLYALMLATNGIEVDNSVIAAQLGILESDVVGAFSYWQSVGAVRADSDTVEFLPPSSQPIPLVNQEAEPAVQSSTSASQQESAKPSYSTGDVARAISENSTLSEVFLVAQSMLGKTLSTQDTITLYSFYDWLGFKPEIIIMLLDHCISMGKTSMNYIEKVALSWHFHGLFTVEAVNEYLSNMQNVKSFMYAIRKILGILDRNPTASEEAFINGWHEKYGMSEDMVALAYDLCIMQTNKLSMPYMDKIMQRWSEQGINTVEAARLDQESRRDRARSSDGYKKRPISGDFESNNPNAYDYDEMERRMWENMNKDN